MKKEQDIQFVEKVIGALRKTAVELEEFQLKAALGKAEAQDKYEEVKKKFNLFIHDSEFKIKGVKEKIEDLNIKFVLIGKHRDRSIEHLKSVAPPNVEFTGFVSDEELLGWYQKAKVYCQLSMYESFGMTLAEAMACGCVPVAADCAALPEVVGDTGFYVPYGDPKATAEAIEKALQSDKGEEARERVKRLFPIERREKEIIDIVYREIK